MPNENSPTEEAISRFLQTTLRYSLDLTDAVWARLAAEGVPTDEARARGAPADPRTDDELDAICMAEARAWVEANLEKVAAALLGLGTAAIGMRADHPTEMVMVGPFGSGGLLPIQPGEPVNDEGGGQ